MVSVIWRLGAPLLACAIILAQAAMARGDDPVGASYVEALAAPPERAVPALLSLAEATPAHPLAAEMRWDAARLALDHLHDGARARPILSGLVADRPGTVIAERARARLAWLDAQGPAADSILGLPAALPALNAWLEAHAAHPLAPVMAVRAAAIEKGPAALERLAPYAGHPQWGWLVGREITRRLYYEGRYVDALQRAADDDVAGQRRALRMIVWRSACALLVALVGLLGWLWLRRRPRQRAAGIEQHPGKRTRREPDEARER